MRPIASVLIDFHREAARSRMIHTPVLDEAMDETPSELPIDIDALTGEAEARGYERGREDAIRELQDASHQQAADMATDFETRLTEARQHWAEAEGLRLGDLIDARLHELQSTIGDQVAAILEALLKPALQQQILEQVLNALETFTRQDRTMLLQVHGPSDLIDEIRKALGTRVRSVDLIANDEIDVRITANDTEIESHLAGVLSDTKVDRAS